MLRQHQHQGFASSAPEVRILEVGPRDGLQNIKASVPTPLKIELIDRLAQTGLKSIEATSFVSPKWVPQLADGAEVMKAVIPPAIKTSLRLPVLAPNLRGVENAIAAGAKEVVVFASATEAFSKKNQNCTVDEALDGAQKVADSAHKKGVAVRGVISCIFSDPYSGPTDPERVLYAAQRFLDMGCHEVGLGDTLGVGTAVNTEKLLEFMLRKIRPNELAGHFHDTYGQAVANVLKSYEMGLRSFDSSIAGLGGCPYAPGAKGNVATEDIVYAFEKSGINTGIDLQKLVAVGDWISKQLNLPNNSRAGAAIFAKQETQAQATHAAQSTSIPKSPRTWTVVEETEGYKVSRAQNDIKITLTRPKNGNAMTTAMVEGLTRLFNNFANDKSVFHIVLAAEGKYFCTGMDLTGDSRADSGSYYSKIQGLFDAIDNSPQTTVAIIQGPCFGGGVGLGFVCDIRLATSSSRWTLSEIKLGVVPATISKYMVREWGFGFLREAMLTGREVKAEELQRVGAVHGIAKDADGLNRLVGEYLDKLSKCAPQSAADCKELIRLAWTDSGGSKQSEKTRQTFKEMMAPGSEGEYGIQQFQKKIKSVDWGRFWSAKAKL